MGPDFLLEALLGDVLQHVGVQRAQVDSSNGVELSTAQFVPFLTQILRDYGLSLDETKHPFMRTHKLIYCMHIPDRLVYLFAHQARVPLPVGRVHQSRECVDLSDAPHADVVDSGHTGRRA